MACALVVGCSNSAAAPAVDAAVSTDAPADVVVSVDAPTVADVPRDVVPDVPFVVAAHDPLPQVPNAGGTILAHPRIVPITYDDDPYRDTMEAHLRWLVGSDWLRTVGAEYGVGEGSVLGVLHRAGNAPDRITSPQIAAAIAAGINDGTLPMGPDGTLADVLYIAYYPAHTTIVEPGVGGTVMSCVNDGGYHSESVARAGRFAYAVIPTCPVPVAFASLTQVEVRENAVSHEIIEAATDALPATAPAWTIPRDSDSPWTRIGGEVGDLCALTLHVVRDQGFIAQRVFSNAAAALGDRDPCIPADPAHIFTTVSVTPDAIQVVDPGSTVTFTLRGWTTALATPFTVATYASGSFMPVLALDRTALDNGGTATLRVTVPATAPAHGSATVYVYASRSRSDYEIVPVVVAVP